MHRKSHILRSERIPQNRCAFTYRPVLESRNQYIERAQITALSASHQLRQRSLRLSSYRIGSGH